MGVSNTLRLAVIADMDDIKLSNDFEIDVRAVYQEPIELAKRQAPCVVILPGEGGSDVDELTNRTSKTVQMFNLELAVKGNDRHSDIHKLLDAVRNALERSTGNVNTAAGVQQVDVEDWEHMGLSSDALTQNWSIVDCAVRIEYTHTRGSA